MVNLTPTQGHGGITDRQIIINAARHQPADHLTDRWQCSLRSDAGRESRTLSEWAPGPRPQRNFQRGPLATAVRVAPLGGAVGRRSSAACVADHSLVWSCTDAPAITVRDLRPGEDRAQVWYPVESPQRGLEWTKHCLEE
jgi:hypothetical protein